jgi:predicted Zn-dependent protease
MRRISSLGLRPALFLAMALCTACAPAQPRVQPPRPVAQAASSTYDYLEYQALLQQMSRTASTARLSPEAFARTLALQKAAARALDRVIARESAPSLYMDKAFLYWNPEQAGQARTILDQGLEKYPNDYNLNAALANAYLMENRLAEAGPPCSPAIFRARRTPPCASVWASSTWTRNSRKRRWRP